MPWLYLKGFSSGEMGFGLEVVLGSEAKGLSASTVSWLKQTWAQDYRIWNEKRVDKYRWVYVWADAVYSGLRAEQTKLWALVIIGVNERGEKHFLAIEDGVRESSQPCCRWGNIRNGRCKLQGGMSTGPRRDTIGSNNPSYLSGMHTRAYLEQKAIFRRLVEDSSC